jgi:hypothetical protein
VKITSTWFRLAGFVLAVLLIAGVAGAQQPLSFLNSGGPGSPEGGLQDCTDYDAYQQPMDAGNLNTARTSDEEAGFLVAEDFVDGTGTVTPMAGETGGIRWWGISFNFGAGAFCTDDDLADTPFDITFSDGDATGPGATVASVTGVVASFVDTGVPFNVSTVIEYSATFPGVDITGATWVSIQRQQGVAGCNWLWVDENLAGSYDDLAFQGGLVPTDQTMCLQAAPAVAPTSIPTLGQFGIVFLLLSLIGAGIHRIRRGR